MALDASQPSGTSVFEERWWLDLVAPGSWRELLVAEGAECTGRLVVQQVRKAGLTLLRNPPLTPVIGPRLTTTAEKLEGRTAQVRALTESLVAQLPRVHHMRLVFCPDFDDFLPFRWAGFQVGVAGTYRLDDVTDLDRIWAGFSESCRRAIRKAQRLVAVRDDVGPDRAIEMVAKSFSRQGRKLPFSAETLVRVIREAQRRSAAHCLLAESAEGVPHAAAIIVHDSRAAYYLAGGADPELRSSGAQSLLLWEAIRRTASASSAFDFEGSSNRQIENFFRGFGARRVPLLMVSRLHPVLRCADAVGVLPQALRDA